MEPEQPPIASEPEVFLPVMDGPILLLGQIAAYLFVALPFLALIAAIAKLRLSDENRRLHVTLAVASGTACLLMAVTWFLPGLIPPLWYQNGVIYFVWVFLYAWMALDFVRSALRTGLRPRWTDIPVLTAAAGSLLAASALPFL